MEYSCKDCKFFRKTKKLIDHQWNYDDNICIMPIMANWDDFPLVHVTEEDYCECFEEKVKDDH